MKKRKIKTLIIASGYFDPVHVGHIEYLELAKELGDKLIVIINTDKQAVKKKGYAFMNQVERSQIINALECVNDTIICEDEDSSVCETIRLVYKLYKPQFDRIIFAKGGDRFSFEIPEAVVCRELGIEIIDGLGLKKQSSSELVERSKKY